MGRADRSFVSLPVWRILQNRGLVILRPLAGSFRSVFAQSYGRRVGVDPVPVICGAWRVLHVDNDTAWMQEDVSVRLA